MPLLVNLTFQVTVKAVVWHLNDKSTLIRASNALSAYSLTIYEVTLVLIVASNEHLSLGIINFSIDF